MKDEIYQQFGALFSSMEHNTKLTEKISDKVDKIDRDMSTLQGVVGGHADYLKNLNERFVTQRENHEALHKRVTVIETKNDSNSGVFKWVLGIVASVVGAIVTLFVTKP